MRTKNMHRRQWPKKTLLSVLLVCCVAFTTIYSSIAYAASGNNYDTTPPVLEGVTFVQQGQTVSVKDELEVDVQCYDAESEIKYIELCVYCPQINGATGDYVTFYPASGEDDDNNGYTYTFDSANKAALKFSLEDVKSTWTASTAYLGNVRIVDTYGNVMTKSFADDAYTCNVSDYTKVDGQTPDTEDHKSVYLDATCSVDKTTLSKEGDTAHITVALAEDAEVPFDETTSYTTYVNGYYNSDDGKYSASDSSTNIKMTYNPSKKTFEGDLSWNPYMLNGTRYISNYGASLWTQDATYYLSNQMGTSKSVSVTIENANSADFSLTAVANKTSSVTEKDYYVAGDTITYSIPAEGREKLYTSAYLSFSPVASAELSNPTVDLEYNQETDCYEGTLTITDDTYPCEWRVESIWLNGHDDDDWYSLYFNPTSKAYCYDDNYYFSVMQKNTFSAATGSVNLTIRYVDENKTWQTIMVSKDQVASRQMTYADLLEDNDQNIDFSEIAAKTGYTLAGFRDSYSHMMSGTNGDELIDLDTPIVFDSNNGSYTATLTAKYEGVEFLNISKTYLIWQRSPYVGDQVTGNAGYYTMANDYDNMVAVKDDVTIGQTIQDYVASPKEINGLTFTGWTLNSGSYSADLTADTKVSDYVKNYYFGSPSLYITASYDKKVVNAMYSYIGQGTSTRSYYSAYVLLDEDATYADALEALQETDLYKNALHDPKLTVEDIEIKSSSSEYDSETNTYTYKTIDPATAITEPISGVRIDTVYDKYKVALTATEADYTYGVYTRQQAYYVDKDSDSEFDLPDTITDYEDITWKYYYGNGMMQTSLNGKTSIPITTDIYVYGTGTYTGERYTQPTYSPNYSPEVDDENPTASIIIGKNTYDTLANKADITYKTYLTKEDEISIAAEDNKGISNIMYYVASEPFADGTFDTFGGLTGALAGKTSFYTDPFTISVDGSYVIYAVAIDKSFNYTVVSTNGIVVDSTAPVITGIEDGKTYNGETSFSVVDKNLSKVYVNGKEVTSSNGTYTLSVKDKEAQTIKAVDKAGNETSISVYVNNKPHEHSYVSQIVSPEYLATEATCTKAATYYYACSCGQKSDATYTYGDALGHDFSSEYTVDKEATVDEMGYTSRHCSRCDATTGGHTTPKLVINTQTNQVVRIVEDTTTTTTPTTATTPTSSQIAALTNNTAAEQTVTEEKPVVKMAEEKIVETVAAIAQAKSGDKVTVEMSGATVVSKEILKEAKEKGVDVVLQMDGYSWTIDAKDIKGVNLEDINLEVDLHAEAIPSKQIAKLAGDNPVTQISLTHEGNFGFAATLSFNLGSEYKDKFGNLYWYDSTGKMIFIDSGLIDEDGNVSLTFSHASDYAIVMKDTDDAETIAAADTSSDSTVASTSDTGFVASNHIVLWVLVAVVVVAILTGTIVYTKKRRK